jgi:hypothetical protein
VDDKGVINLGLGLLGAYSVTSIDPPVTPIEKRMAQFYPHWRKSELTRRRWVFNRKYKVLTISPDAPMETADRPYGYLLPNDYLAAVRDKTTRWQVRGRYVYNSNDEMVLEYKADIPTTEFDPLFVDVLAARIAYENCEWVTQSNMKKADAERYYKDMLRLASANNALIIGSEDDMTDLDDDDTWIMSRAGYGL